MADGKLNITVLTAEDSLKVFRMTQERIDAALERFPEFKDKVNISITRTSTSFENDPSWNAEDYVKFRKGVADAAPEMDTHHRRRRRASAAARLVA